MDALFQNLSTVQSNQQPPPNTIASAATIAPTTLMTYVTGTVQIANITPFVSGQHMIILVFTNAAPGVLLTTGNIDNAITPTQNLPTVLFYDPARNKYVGGTFNLT